MPPLRAMPHRTSTAMPPLRAMPHRTSEAMPPLRAMSCRNCAHGYATACINDMSTNPGDFVPGACLAVLCTLHVDIRDQTHALVIGLGGVRISPPLPFRICADLFACCPILVSSVSELCLVLGEFAQRTLSCFGSELCLVLGSRATESVPRLNKSVYLHTSRLWRPRLRAPLWPIFIW